METWTKYQPACFALYVTDSLAPGPVERPAISRRLAAAPIFWKPGFHSTRLVSVPALPCMLTRIRSPRRSCTR